MKRWLPSRVKDTSCDTSGVTIIKTSNVMSAYVFLAIGAGVAGCIGLIEKLQARTKIMDGKGFRSR